MVRNPLVSLVVAALSVAGLSLPAPDAHAAATPYTHADTKPGAHTVTKPGTRGVADTKPGTQGDAEAGAKPGTRGDAHGDAKAGTRGDVDGDAKAGTRGDVDAVAGGGGRDPLRLARAHGFYADPAAHPDEWVAANGGDPRAEPIRAAMAGRPGARWFGNWSGDIESAVDAYVSAAAAVHQVPMLVAYNIPDRDCGGASGGGAGTPAAYREWIDAFAAGVDGRAALVIIEPDSLAQAYAGCIPDAGELQTRFDLISYALDAFDGNAWTYADGGNAHWWPAAEMAQRLNRAGVANAHGVAINVSNFYTTAESTTYGDAVRAETGGKPYLIDTSRNGAGGNPGEWCNPPGARLGAPSSVPSPGTGAEFLVWVKVVGDSDGPCGAGPGVPAGTFSPDLALGLIGS